MTPNELARELHRSPKTIRAFLRSRYGRLWERGETRWHLTPVQEQAVRARFG
jgi:hypothetical protein